MAKGGRRASSADESSNTASLGVRATNVLTIGDVAVTTREHRAIWREDEFSQPVTLFGGSKPLPQPCRGRERREHAARDVLLAMTEKSLQRRPHIGHSRTQRGITATRSGPWGREPCGARDPAQRTRTPLAGRNCCATNNFRPGQSPNEMPRSLWRATSTRLTQHGSRTLRHRTCRRSRSICGDAPTCCQQWS